MPTEPSLPEVATSVLVVGGGYAGLAAALFLAHQGVDTVLVDRHPGVSVQGRARGINQRTMEIYRPLGLEPAIEAAGRPFDEEAGVVRCSSLAGEWNWILADESRQALPDLTPSRFGMADQRTVEPVLIEGARARGADIRFGTRCVGLEQREDGVRSVVEDLSTGERLRVSSDYVIAADGFRGTLGPSAGITREGPGVTQHWVTFIVRADLSGLVQKRAMFWIVVNDEIGMGSFLTTSVDGEWAISVTYDPATQSAADFTAERCLAVARSVIGVDVPTEIVDVAAWEEAVGVVDHYRAGRVFVAGDSAHVWPPAGAMGANAAVQDVHNLAWKLAAVLAGRAGDALLDTYEAERRPVAGTLAALTVRRQEARFGGRPMDDDVDDTLCALGQRYSSAAVAGPDHDGVFGAGLEDGAVPGLRVPHLWLRHEGRRISVLDLVHDRFVLLAGPAGEAWAAAARDASLATRVPLAAVRIGSDEYADVDGVWEQRFRMPMGGAVLVRPDGCVAWVSLSPDADAGELAGVLKKVLAV